MDNTYLGFFYYLFFFSLLCFFRKEKTNLSEGIFQAPVSLTFTSFGQKETSKEDGEQEERIGHAPPTPHTHTCQWHFHQGHISSVAAALLQGLWPLLTPFSVGWSCFLLLFFLGCLPIHWLFSHLFHISNQFKFPLYHIVKWKRTKIEKLEVQSNVRVQFF